MAAHELSMQLMREREMLELLLFKLDVQQMLVATGRNRWVQHAANEVERVLAAMPATAITRDTLVVAVADEWGVPEATSLRELIDAAPTDAWREIFTGHLEALLALAAEITEMKAINEQRLRTALRIVQETIAALDNSTGEYDPSGEVIRPSGSHILDTRA